MQTWWNTKHHPGRLQIKTKFRQILQSLQNGHGVLPEQKMLLRNSTRLYKRMRAIRNRTQKLAKANRMRSVKFQKEAQTQSADTESSTEIE